MGIMDLFKKKKEEEIPEYPRPADLTPVEPTSPMGMEHLGMPHPAPEPFAQPESFAQPRAFGQQPSSTDQQLQLISAKLDTLKAQLDTILQRLDRLERKGEEERPYQQRWRQSI